jgi:hypothetical protein
MTAKIPSCSQEMARRGRVGRSLGDARPSRQTKPISHKRHRDHGFLPRPSPLWPPTLPAPVVQTKPIRAWGKDRWGYKWTPMRQTNPIWPSRQAGGVAQERKRAKQSQLGPGVQVPARPNVQNEPNSRRDRVGRGLGDEGQLCETNPISKSGPAGPGTDHAEQSQFPAAPVG